MGLKKAGFSLVQVLVGFGLLAVLSLAVVSLMRVSQRGAKSVGASIDYDALESTLLLALRDPDSCTQSFKTAKLDPATGVLSEPGGAPLSVKIGSSVVAKPNLVIGNRLEVVQIEISQVPGTTASATTVQVGGAPPVFKQVSRYRMSVKVTARRTGGDGVPMGGSALHNLNFFVWLDVDPSAGSPYPVVKCGQDVMPRVGGSFSVMDFILNSKSPTNGDATHVPWCNVQNPVTGTCSCPSGFLPYYQGGFSNPACANGNYCFAQTPSGAPKKQWAAGGISTYQCLEPSLTAIPPADTHTGPSDFENIPRCRTLSLNPAKGSAVPGSYEGANPCCYSGDTTRAFSTGTYVEAGNTIRYASDGVFVDPASAPGPLGTIFPRCL